MSSENEGQLSPIPEEIIYAPTQNIDWASIRIANENATAQIEAALLNTSDAFARVDLLVGLADRLRIKAIDRMHVLLEEARELASKIGYAEGLANCLGDLARYELGVSHLDDVARLCFEAIETVKDLPHGAALAKAHLEMGWMFNYLGDYTASMDWGFKGLEICRGARANGVEAAIVPVHTRLLDLVACIYSQLEDHGAALQVHEDAKSMAEATGDLFIYASVLNNRAMTMLYAGELERALESGMRSLEIGRQMGMMHQVYNFADSVGEILLAMGRLEDAERVLHEAHEIIQGIPFDITHAFVVRNLGRVSLARGNLDAARTHLENAIGMMNSFNIRGELAICHKLMAEVCEKQSHFHAALRHFRTFYELHEATTGKESARRLAVLKTSYDMQLAQRDAEIERLRNTELQAEIEERKRAQIALEQLATTDTLTNLSNRHHFFVQAEREVDRALRYNVPLSMLILDLDYFKRVNDTLGHIAGDQVLVAIGKTIRAVLRDVDLAGRYGGEEFAILLPETNLDNALSASERLRAAIAKQIVLTDSGRVSVTASFGVATLWIDAQTTPRERNAARELAGMLDRADRALYMAKRAGRNTSVVFNGE